MHHTRSLLFSICFHLFFVNGTTIPHVDSQDSPVYDRPCPDGLLGRVTQIQQQSLSSPSRPAIYITDCSPSRNSTLTPFNPFEISTLDKRQEQICPADCSNQCSSSGPSNSDCANLANQLSDRNTQFTVSGSQTISMTYGTCMFQLVNMVDSPFIYCDINWAAKAKGVIASCPSSGGMCQGSRFQAVVAVNNLASSTTASPAPVTTTANNPATTNQGGSSNTGATISSSGNGGGNTGNSNGASGPTGSSNTISSSAPLGTLPNTLAVSQSGGSGISTTTLSNGSVLVLPTGSFGAGGSSVTGALQPSGSSINIPAIIGAILGLLVLLALVILFFLWRRKRRAQRKLASFDALLSLRESTVARIIGTDRTLDLTSAPGFQGGAGIGVRETATRASIWATGNKGRIFAEGAVSNTSDTDLSSIELSVYDSIPAPAYRSQSSSSRREREGGRRRDRTGGGSRGHSHEHPAVLQQTDNSSNQCDRDGYASNGDSTLATNSTSMSARTFAQAAAPSLSARDIDRLAESIVARMQGRDPALRERIVEEGESEFTEDEPPPPWSAPGVNAHGP